MSILFTIAGCTNISAQRKFTSIDLPNVKVGGEIGRRIDVTVNNNIFALDVKNDFLQPFRNKTHEYGYIGLGKFIDSLVSFAAYINDERLLRLKEHVVTEIIKTQQSDGYIGTFASQYRMWNTWDIHEMGYIVLGLTSDYEHFGQKQSLDAAKKLADYIITRWSDQPQRIPGGGDIAVQLATTGLETAMLKLYEQTAETRYIDFCLNHRKLAEWSQPIVLGRHGKVAGHAYSYIATCLAQLELYRIQPDKKLLRQTEGMIDFLTAGDGLVIQGTCGSHECWNNAQQGTGSVGETCATAYLIRLMDTLLRIKGDSYYGDLMERSIYNALFAAQSLGGRRLRYYVPSEGPRRYFTKDTYCCPCNFRRIIAELPAMIYYRCNDGLAVNLYTQSSATIKLKGRLSLDVQQQTDYPNSGKVVIILNPSKSARFPLLLRVPRWCDDAHISVNGKPIKRPISNGSFFRIERLWNPADKVELRMSMPWRLVKGRKIQAGRVAVMRGPIVFCLNPKHNKDVKTEQLREITLDPKSLQGPEKNSTVRPNGTACRLRAWGPGKYDRGLVAPDMELLLTEFADPNGRATHMLVPNPGANLLTDDELMKQ